MQKQKKSQLIEQLKKTPIVSIACKKAGVSRATHYRWCNSDTNFKKASDEAIQEGVMLMNDMAESQLLNAIRDGNSTAIFYWLNHRHPAYKTKLELSGHIKASNVPLTPQQEETIKEALRLAALKEEDFLPPNNTPHEKN